MQEEKRMEPPVTLCLIVARSRNGVIGKDGDLPWRLSDDLKLFKQATLGKPVIMGRKTWESLPVKPLPRRQNIVLTRDWEYAAPGARVYSSFSAAVAAAKAMAAKDGKDEVFVIGGESLYRKALSMADRLYITEVDVELDGDAHFPMDGEDAFIEAGSTAYPANGENDYPFTYRILERRI